jgi:prophage DNA circulation protein
VSSWKERLLPASFRGLPFELVASDVTVGRRKARHEYPGRDLSQLDDFGRRSDEFTLAVFFVGDDHDQQAALFSSLMKEGTPGELELPLDGRIFVAPIDARRRSVATETNVTWFEATFLEVEETPAPAPNDPDRELSVSAAASRKQARADLEAGVVSDGVPEYVRGGTGSGISAVGGALRALRFAQDAQKDVSAFTNTVNALVNGAAALATAPADLGLAVLAATDSIRATATSAVESFYAYQALFDVAARRIPGSSPFAVQANQNQDLVLRTARVGATYGAVLAAADAEWASTDALADATAATLEQLDLLEADAGSELYLALERLRLAFLTSLDNARVKSTRTVTLSRSRPSLVLAYVLFDDATRAAEVVAAARTRDPLFVAGGVPITVADDG